MHDQAPSTLDKDDQAAKATETQQPLAALGWPEALVQGLETSLTALTRADAAIARFAAAATMPGWPDLRGAARRALEAGLSRDVLAELCLQCTLYAGPGNTAAMQEALGDLVLLPTALAAPTTSGPATLRANVHGRRDGESHSDPQDPVTAPLYGVVAEFGYGAIWSRPGPSRRQRLICAVAALAVSGSRDGLRKFVSAGREGGLAWDELRDAISWTVLVQGAPRTFDALSSVRDIIDEG